VGLRKCPFCGESNSQLKVKVSRSGGEYDIVSCKACDFVFVDNPRESTADNDPAPTSIQKPKPRHYQIEKLLLLNKERRKINSVVEIGAGFGTLGALLKNNFEYIGFEPGEGRTEYCRKNGLDVRAEYFTASKLNKKVDAIILDNVLEHVQDPRQILDEVSKALRPGGIAIIIVPNVKDLRQLSPSWKKTRHWIPPDHINYFSYSHLKKMLIDYEMKTLEPFGVQAVRSAKDLKFLPRIALDALNLHFFGLNFIATRD
jgi:SAM-dependent methyltransferase